MSRCKNVPVAERPGCLPAVPPASYHEQIRAAVDHAKSHVAELKLSELKQDGKPEMTLAELQKEKVVHACFKLVEKQLAESLMKATQILKSTLLVLAIVVFLTQCETD